MIFKRRERPGPLDRFRQALLPRKGWWRGFDYIHKRLRRLPDSPHRIALGFACGAFASFTPFFGLHFLIAAGLGWLLRANILASLFGTVVGNPLTFPVIATTSLWMGRWIMGRRAESGNFRAISHAFADGMNAIWATVQHWFGYGPSMLAGLREFLNDLFLPYLIGGIIPGLITGAVCYWLIGPIVAAYQQRRRRKLMAIQARQRTRLDEELSAYDAADNGDGNG